MGKRNVLLLALIILFGLIVFADNSIACTDEYYNSVSACCDGNCPSCSGSSCSCPSGLCGVGSCPDCSTTDYGDDDTTTGSEDTTGEGSTTPPTPQCGQAGYCGVYGNYPGCKACFNPKAHNPTNPSVEVPANIPEIFSNPFWQKAWTGLVPNGKVHLIPPDKIDVMAVQNKMEITKAQLQYGNNFALIYDKSLLHPDVVNQIISGYAGIELQVVLQPGSQITLKNGKILISKATILKTKCQNSDSFVEIESPAYLALSYADSFLTVVIPPASSNKITGCDRKQFIYSSGQKDGGGQLSVSTNLYDPRIILSDSSIELGSETLSTNSTAEVTLDFNVGFVCLKLGIGSEYRNDAQGIFAIEPMDGSDYELCLKKKQGQLFSQIQSESCTNCGILDILANQSSIIKGRLAYKLYSQEQWFSVLDSFEGKLGFTGLNLVGSTMSSNNPYTLINLANNVLLKEEQGILFINKYSLLLDSRAEFLLSSYASQAGINATTNNNSAVLDDLITIFRKSSLAEEVFLYG